MYLRLYLHLSDNWDREQWPSYRSRS